MSSPRVSLRAVRTAVAALLVLDLLVLLAFSVSKQTVTRTTSQPLPGQPIAPAPPTPPVTSAPIAAAPLPVIAPGVLVPSGPAVVNRSTVVAPHPGLPTPPATSPPTTSGESGEALAAKCPVMITTSRPPAGGLQSLIALAPTFGAFSAEAFASASAYQPVLQLLGPILAQYPKLAPKLEPFVTPFVSTFQALTNSIFALIGPLYTPYRHRVLDAETKLAAALAPYAEKLVDSPLGGCVVQLETALVQDTRG